MPCLQLPRAGAEQTPRCPLRARCKAPKSKAEGEHWLGSRGKPAATRIDRQEENAALRLGSRKFRRPRADGSRNRQSRSVLRLDSSEPRTSDRSAASLPTAIGFHPASCASSDSSEDTDQLLLEDRAIATSFPGRQNLSCTSETTYNNKIPSSGSMGCRYRG